MKKSLAALLLISSATAQTGLTIYNQNIAVVRETIPLNLAAGVTSVNFDQATAQVRPDSVVLRDPAGKVDFSVLEQSYRNDPISQGLMLQHFEGKAILFKKEIQDGTRQIIKGKIIRSGYGRNGGTPIIESKGSLMFKLPGEPMFPALSDDSILRPTLSWQIDSEAVAKLDAQLSYLTGGFNWNATYNIVAPEEGETVSLNGWVTLTNRSGTDFKDTTVKLVAGDVNVTRQRNSDPFGDDGGSGGGFISARKSAAVTEKAFDDFHLYSLPRPLALRDRETKQVEFLRSDKIQAKKTYVYSPAQMRFYGGWNYGSNLGSNYPTDVATYWEFQNTKANGLGVPLPAGVMRFYRSDKADGNLEFVGENRIKHTPKKEKISVKTGTAFDLLGERTITNFKSSEHEKWVRESFKIIVKNRSEKVRTILVREPLWRWSNWKIEKNSINYQKLNSQEIEFSVTLQPNTVQNITYTAHYSAEPK